MAKKPIKITEVVLRDAHQSLLATRMTMDEMRPILPEMDKIPYFSVECWGGATFDVCLRYLNEDPWERLRKIRAAVPNTKLQMLLQLGVRLEAGQHAGGVVVIEQLAAEFQIQLVVELRDPLPDVLRLHLKVFVVVKSFFHSLLLFFVTNPAAAVTPWAAAGSFNTWNQYTISSRAAQ